MKKRLLALLLSTILVMAFAACSGEPAQPVNAGNEDPATQPEETPDTTQGEPQPVEIWLARHGETLFNEKSMAQGWSDAPLTEEGEAFTAYVGMGLKEQGIVFEGVYSSDLTRCLHTSALLVDQLGGNLEIQPDPRLREMHFGEFEGEKTAALSEAYPNIYNFDEFPGTPGGEDWSQLLDRVLPAILEIGEAHSAQGGKVLVVSHGMVILDMIHYVDPDFVVTPGVMPNNSITVLVYENGALSLKSMPDTSYADIGMELAGVSHDESEPKAEAEDTAEESESEPGPSDEEAEDTEEPAPVPDGELPDEMPEETLPDEMPQESDNP